MSFEKPNYIEENPEKKRLALERKRAIEEGRLPEWEAKQRVQEGIEAQLIPPKIVDYRAGNPEKLKVHLDNLHRLYPKSKEEGEEKRAA